MEAGESQDRGRRFEEIAMAVRNRDAGQCRKCGVAERGERLHVHHLIPDANIPNELDAHLPVNLVSLCPECHAKLESLSLFSQLMKMNIDDQASLMLSEGARNKVNNRLDKIGPAILTTKKISTEGSEALLEFGGVNSADQTDLSQFQD